MNNYQEVWRFQTKSLAIVLDVAPCDDNQADHFDFPEDVETASSGDLCDWFAARVRVLSRYDGRELGADYLGCCSYASLEEFFQAHRAPDHTNRNCSLMRAGHGHNVVICHYFPSMVSEAVTRARQNLDMLHTIRLRVA